jgi:hypothetical protein
MMEGPGPLPPDLDALLDAERRCPDPPTQVRARVLSRFRSTIGVGAAPAMATPLLAPPAVLALVMFTLGVAAGIGAQKWIDRRPKPARPAATVARPTQPEPSTPAAVRAEPAPPPDVMPSAPKPAVVRPKPSKPVPVPDEMETERVMIQLARVRLAQKDGSAALQVIERHARAFPDGALAEEREALAVKALILAGYAEAARARGAQFRARYPRSIYLPVVEKSLEAIP